MGHGAGAGIGDVGPCVGGAAASSISSCSAMWASSVDPRLGKRSSAGDRFEQEDVKDHTHIGGHDEIIA
jgi:hypothetical protein